MTVAGTGRLAIVGGRVIPVAGAPFEDGVVLIADGRIEAAGRDVRVPDGVERVDAAGKVVLPGLVDAHVHLGVHEEGDGWAGQDTNELTDPVTPHVRALDAINPADLGFADAVAGGVLTVNVNPGSGNPIGGQTAAVRSAGRSVDEMVLRAPSGMKSALGENPKRVYGERKQFPSTRLGTAAAIRDALVKTANYLAKRDHDGDEPAERDLRWEALGLVLTGEIPWRQHCHRADDIATAMRLADEFGYRLVIDHGTEAVLLADRLAERGIPVLIGPLLTSRSKVELRNRSLANPARLAAAGVELGIITDHPVVPVHLLHVQAALAVREGLDPADALRAVTLTPARVLGLEDRLGSLEPGKHATLCVWSGDPLDARSRVESAWIEGRQVYRTGPGSPSAF
ncbi:MAG TPA: amidohydrolase [Actinomycetes bacterium]|nr:amidohydrolase [Actinomycetes bacterium]